MHLFPALGLTAALAAAVLPAHAAATLEGAAAQLGANGTKSLAFSGTGEWFQFGQAPNPSLPWPRFNVTRYAADINFDTASARVRITRSQALEAKRERPAAVEQRVDQYVSGASAWSVATTPAAPGAAPAVTAQPAAAEERGAEIWATPQGFLKAALAHQAVAKPAGNGLTVSFTADRHRYVGTINARNQVERVQTWIDNPVLGDTLYETRFSDYQDFGGVQFPATIARSLGGHPILKLTVANVSANPAVDIAAPAQANAAPAVTVTVDKLGDGVFYLTGGSHHSVAIEQRDHIVVVEAPLNEERSLAVIAKVKETIPGKPIKYLVNTHAHFDHSGGLRTYVAEGATIVTQKANQSYYQKAWAAPHALNPDLLAKANAKANAKASFKTFGDRLVLPDAKQPVEIYQIAGNSHNDAFALVYLPSEKVLIEADAYTPAAANAAPSSAAPNPYSVNLYRNLKQLKLDVDRIAPLHGRQVTLADLRAAIGQANSAQ